MTAVLGGLGAALLWGLSTVAASRSTRRIGTRAVLAYVMVVGLAAAFAAALPGGGPRRVEAGALAAAIGSGLTTSLGLGLAYFALARGKVGLVSPVIALEGAFAAAIAVAAGERPGAAVGVGLALAALGLLAVTYRGGSQERVALAPLLIALASAAVFGVGLVASAHAGRVLGPGWTIVVTRAVGVCVVTLPLAAAGRLPRLGRGDPALALVVFSGLAEVGGFVCYLVAAREAVAVAAVLGSQFAAVAAAGSYLLLGERLTRLQLAGSGAILAGVAVISAFQR